MIKFVKVALETEWQPEIKQRYLQQFVAYEIQDMNSTHKRYADKFNDLPIWTVICTLVDIFLYVYS